MEGQEMEQFIQEVISLPVIWDRKNQFKHKGAKLNAWKEVAKRTGMEVSDAMRLLKSVREKYRRETLKMERFTPNEITDKWSLYDKCSFLKEVQKPRRPSIAVRQKNSEVGDDSNDISLHGESSQGGDNTNTTRIYTSAGRMDGKSLAIFIEDVISHPVIWDRTKQVFCNKTSKERAWQQVAEKQGMDGAKRLFKAIREKYRRETLKMKHRKGCEKWELFDLCSFLKDVQRSRWSTNAPNSSGNYQHDSEMDEEEEEGNDSDLISVEGEESFTVDTKYDIFNSSSFDTKPSFPIDIPSSSIGNTFDIAPQSGITKENFLPTLTRTDNFERASQIIQPTTLIQSYCNHLAVELSVFPDRDANSFMDEVTMLLLQKKKKLRNENKM